MIPAGMFRNIGRAGASRFFGNRTAVGAVAGAGYGAISDDTSVLGGALMGAGAGRYLGAGVLSAMHSGRGLGFGASVRAYGQAFGRGVSNMARRDWRRLRVASNSGVNRVRSTLKGW
jgi:hypothetical protein